MTRVGERQRSPDRVGAVALCRVPPIHKAAAASTRSDNHQGNYTIRGIVMKKKALTGNQVQWLTTISLAGSAGLTLSKLFNLRGSSRDWQSSYRRSLESAAAAHNEGRANNSPLSSVVRVHVSHSRAAVATDPLILDACNAVAILEVAS